LKIRIKPAAHLDRLEEVLVLQTRQELNLKKGSEAENAPVTPQTVPRTALGSGTPVKKSANAN
jgi:hypothetical protein